MTLSECQLEEQIEKQLIEKLCGLKYEYRSDIRDRKALEKNFREKFQALNHVSLTDAEFQRLLDEIVTPDVFTAARTLRGINAFTRDDGTPLNYTLVNIKDWCKNTFEVVNQLRINTDNSHHRYDGLLLINGVPVTQIELKAFDQTREEFNKFQEGCVEENANTYTLVRRLLSVDYADKFIVTTIQKLDLALRAASPFKYSY